MAVDTSAVRIDLSRDHKFDAFTLQTLRDRYMVPGETSPQQAFARASAAFADDAAHAQRLYDYVGKGWFMFATPVLSNGGTTRGLPISCFLSTAEDSREGIFDHWTETGWLSSVGGGVGGYWPLRSNGAATSAGSSSTGAIPFVAVVDRLILAVSQGGTRRGSYAAYMDIDHPEIEEFITMRKATGGDANRKGTNLHNAVNITDLFMEAVRDDAEFHLRDPKTRQVTKTLRARDLWRLMIDTRVQTGEPYMHFVDASNRALPKAQRDKGLRVNQSNLCVGPDTELLTSGGYMPIAPLEGCPVKVWNGQEWSAVTVEKTGVDQEMMRVWFSDGSNLDVTPYHKFYDAAGFCVRAGALKVGTYLEASDHPVIDLPTDKTFDQATAYAAGWATFSGFEDNNRLSLFVAEGDDSAVERAVMQRLLTHSVDSHVDAEAGGMFVRYEPTSIPAGRAPMRWSLDARRAWFGGVMDGAGQWIDLDEEGRFLCVATTDGDMVEEMRLAALESGMTPRIRVSDTGSSFALSKDDITLLALSGHILRSQPDLKTLSLTPAPVMVTDVHPLPWRTDTYCFTEVYRGRGVFNGVLTGNCTEIMLATGRDDTGAKRTAVCCLSSVSAETFDEWRHDPRFIEDLMRMLDNVLQVFIDTAPPELAYAVYSATQERSVGLGLMGFHSALQDRLIPFESDAARAFNKALFRHLRAGADAASRKLAIERGEAPDMVGYGERFAHKLANAPNASSSILCRGTSPSTEANRANAYLHKTLSGSFPVKNRFLARELALLGMDNDETWKAIIGAEGSVQHLDIPDLLKQVFKTATEIAQIWLIVHAADRGDDICQGQSTNVFFPAGTDAGAIVETHFMAWEWGLKSLYYLRSTAPKRGENTNAVVTRAATKPEFPELGDVDLGALVDAAGAAEDDSCFMCQG